MEPNKESGNIIYSNRQIPLGHLSLFVDCYVFREIRVKAGSPISKFMPCRHSNSIDFFIGDSYDTVDLQKGRYVPFARCTIRGPRTYKKYQMRILGNFKSFNIRFKPAGIYHLFGIPMDNFCDEAVDATLVQSGFFNELTERLMECKDIQSCINIVEPFLLNLVNDRNSKSSVSARLAELMLTSETAIPVKDFYSQFPLTARQLERNFLKEIGVSPKTYSCMIRFERLIKNRMEQPRLKWTEIAYEHNYFDQMHMIKDFHRFLDINPGDFSPSDFAF